MNKIIRIVGIGNPYRRDDGFGPAVVRALRRELPDSVEVFEDSGEGATLMDRFAGADVVLFVDAARSTSSPAGTYVTFDAATETIPSDYFNYSTHAFSLAEAVELAKALQLLPGAVWIHAVTAADFSAGEGLSEEVASTIPQVVESVITQVNKLVHEDA